METDALLIMVLSVLVWQHDKAGVWVLGVRPDAVRVRGGRMAAALDGGPLTPTRRGKTVAVAQVAGLAFALLPVVPPVDQQTRRSVDAGGAHVVICRGRSQVVVRAS